MKRETMEWKEKKDSLERVVRRLEEANWNTADRIDEVYGQDC